VTTFTYVPSVSTRGQMQARVRKAAFNDQFEQREKDGVNNQLQAWNLRFNNRASTELAAIDAYLLALGGANRFLWTPPAPYDTAARAFVCESWEWVYARGGIASGISAVFEERPVL
jgi:phage-related protein